MLCTVVRIMCIKKNLFFSNVYKIKQNIKTVYRERSDR